VDFYAALLASANDAIALARLAENGTRVDNPVTGTDTVLIKPANALALGFNFGPADLLHPTAQSQPEDFFRFDASGNRSFAMSSNAQAFLSLNNTTDLAQFDNQNVAATSEIGQAIRCRTASSRKCRMHSARPEPIRI